MWTERQPPPPPHTPSFESSSVLLYITPTYTSYIQVLILQGKQHKLQKSCSRCNKDIWHVESNYILQPSKYFLLIINRFRYTKNNVTKDRCSIPTDTTVMKFPLKFKPTGYYKSSWTVYTFRSLYCIYQLLQKHYIATTTKLRSLMLLIVKTPLLHMLHFMNWLTYKFWTGTGRWELDYSNDAGTSSPFY